MNVLVVYGTHEAPAIQDIYFNNPFKHLEKEGSLNFKLVELSNLSFEEVFEYNLVIVSRIFQAKVLELISFCKRSNTEVLFFFDDDILNFPIEYYLSNEPFYKNNEQLIVNILENASALVVSTEKLKTTYQKYNPTIYITPPCINISFVDEQLSKKEAHIQSDDFIIGYAGSFGHVIDFRFMENALLDFYKKYYPKVRIEFMGCVPEAFGSLINNNTVRLVHWQPDYERYLRNILNVQWNIALCPVLGSEYTSHKTNIKFLEYSSASIPGIFSDINIYSNDIKDGWNGLLAKNNYEAWMEKLEYAYANKNNLPEIANVANDYVRTNFSSIKSAENWAIILINYRQSGLAKISKTISIKYHKARKVYSSKGMVGLTKKLSKQYKNRLFINRGQSSKNGKAFASDNYADSMLCRAARNFDVSVIRKQVLFIVPWLSVGGGDMVNLNIAKSLDSKKYSLHFITTEISDHKWEKKFKKISRNIFHIRNIIENTDYFWEYNNLILQYIERANIDVIIISNSAIGYTCLPAIKDRFPHIKIIDILHGQGGSKEGGGFPAFSNPYDDYIETRVVINYYLKKYLIDRYGIKASKIQVIHNTIDTNKYSSKLRDLDSKFIVTYVGRLSYEKHPEYFIDIAEKVLSRTNRNDIRFHLIGNGPLYNELQNQISNKDLSKYIKLKGYKDDVKKQLENTNVLILCSEMEGLPIVLLEAMSMAVPCIASNVGGIPELIDEGVNGFLIEYKDGMIDEFADRILDLYNDNVLQKTIGKNARDKIVGQFSNKHIAAYESLINMDK